MKQERPCASLDLQMFSFFFRKYLEVERLVHRASIHFTKQETGKPMAFWEHFVSPPDAEDNREGKNSFLWQQPLLQER